MLKYYIVLLLYFLCFIPTICTGKIKELPNDETLLVKAQNKLQKNQYDEAIRYLKEYLNYHPNHFDTNQLLGSIYVLQSKFNDALIYLERVFDLYDWRNVIPAINIIESYRQTNQLEKAKKLIVKANKLFPKTAKILKIYAFIELSNMKFLKAKELFLQSVSLDPMDKETWDFLIQITMEHIVDLKETKKLIKQALRFHPKYYLLFYFEGVIHYSNQKYEDAIESYLESYNLNSSHYVALNQIGATYQFLGRTRDAVDYYEQALPHFPKDANLHINYGRLLEELPSSDTRSKNTLQYLLKALKISPYTIEPYLSLSSYFEQRDDLLTAKDYLRQAVNLNISDTIKSKIQIKMNSQLSYLSLSWTDMLKERIHLEKGLLNILVNFPTYNENIVSNTMNSSITSSRKASTVFQYNHRFDTFINFGTLFFLTYQGLYDRYIMELVYKVNSKCILSQMYERRLYERVLPKETSVIVNNENTIRIGFISRFFKLFEPHGMLLSGIMKYLPRSQYTIVLLDGDKVNKETPLASNIANSVDEVYLVKTDYNEAVAQISELRLDVLVFADTVSEAMNNYLTYFRLAKLQIAFWGNPTSCGSENIDYFISSDNMEHPYRTHMTSSSDPYVEQVVLLQGQGIWYDEPISPKFELQHAKMSLKNKLFTAAREEFDLDEDWFLYLLPQAIFKIHPLFDRMIYEILSKTPKNVHFVVLGGRKEVTTNKYISRLREGLDIEMNKRLHVIPIVASERFISICKLANVILHPFPFDGSRTSADALLANIPFVTLPSEYLRGRMGKEFLRTMNIPQLVAKNTSNYIDILLKLYYNEDFYDEMKNKIRESIYLIWEDMEVPFQWLQFLQLATDSFSNEVWTWESFIESTNRNITKERELRTLRSNNRKAFDTIWGKEDWLLNDITMEAILECHYNESNIIENNITATYPRIFQDWKTSSFVSCW